MWDSIRVWANCNDGFIGLITGVLTLGSLPIVLGSLGRIRKRLSTAVSAEEIRRTAEIRRDLYANLRIVEGSGNYGRVLIRDIGRDQLYFNGDENVLEFPQPSFKTEVVDLSVHGLRVMEGFGPTIIKKIEGGSSWCLAEENDPDGVRAFLIGTIPLSNVVTIIWEGDSFAPYPHVFCEYPSKKNGPYSYLEYCERKFLEPGPGRDLYFPLVRFEEVIRRQF